MLETVTVYKDTYEADQQKLFNIQQDYAYTQGTIIALADIIKTNPQFVEEKLQELKKQYKGESA
jgi:hypothetical protein